MARKKIVTISQQLRRHVLDSGLSSYELQSKTGIDASQLSRFQRGERGLTTTTLDLLCQCLNLRLVRTKRK